MQHPLRVHKSLIFLNKFLTMSPKKVKPSTFPPYPKFFPNSPRLFKMEANVNHAMINSAWASFGNSILPPS